MRREILKTMAVIMMAILTLTGCGTAVGEAAETTSEAADTTSGMAESAEEDASPAEAAASDSEWADPSGSAVYITTDISPEGLMAVYNALGVKAEGKNVAVKLSTGEPGSNYLDPNLIKNLVHEVNGTIVECNTAYGGSDRMETEMHLQVAADHGFTEIADVDIMDAEGSVSIPIEGGKYITEDFVGASFPDYDYFVVLSHFKGHEMAGFGGAIKNISIGIASSEGKSWIHSGGKMKEGIGGNLEAFQASMADAGKGVVDSLDGKILYINVMNKLSIDCDCNKHPAKPKIADIGILASLDPVALDQACVDLIYAAPPEDAKSLIKRMESKKGYLALERGEENGLGSRHYNLVSIDD